MKITDLIGSQDKQIQVFGFKASINETLKLSGTYLATSINVVASKGVLTVIPMFKGQIVTSLGDHILIDEIAVSTERDSVVSVLIVGWNIEVSKVLK